MKDLINKCKKNFNQALDHSLFDNMANIVLVIVAALLLISLMIHPMILVGIALFGLFVWALLYC